MFSSGKRNYRFRSAEVIVHADTTRPRQECSKSGAPCRTPLADATCRRGTAKRHQHEEQQHDAVTLLQEHTGFAVSRVAPSAAYPRPGARLVRHLAVTRLTGHVGHDLFVESFFDLYAQQLARNVSFDAVVLEAYRSRGSHSASPALTAASAPPSSHLVVIVIAHCGWLGVVAQVLVPQECVLLRGSPRPTPPL